MLGSKIVAKTSRSPGRLDMIEVHVSAPQHLRFDYAHP
jgi:hypothetical protein